MKWHSQSLLIEQSRIFGFSTISILCVFSSSSIKIFENRVEWVHWDKKKTATTKHVILNSSMGDDGTHKSLIALSLKQSDSLLTVLSLWKSNWIKFKRLHLITKRKQRKTTHYRSYIQISQFVAKSECLLSFMSAFSSCAKKNGIGFHGCLYKIWMKTIKFNEM